VELNAVQCNGLYKVICEQAASLPRTSTFGHADHINTLGRTVPVAELSILLQAAIEIAAGQFDKNTNLSMYS